MTDSHVEAIKLAKKLADNRGGLPNTKVCEKMSCEKAKIIVDICRYIYSFLTEVEILVDLSET